MAETVHLYLKLDGVDVQGESSQSSLGRENSIEIVALGFDLEREETQIRGGEIKFVARIDKAFPPILTGFAQNKVADATFKFFRPNPTGDGTTEQFFTVVGKQGRVTSLSPWVPNCIDPASSNYPPQVQYTLAFHTLVATYTNGGITSEISLN